MAESALLGTPATTQHDREIVEGAWRLLQNHLGPGLKHPPLIPTKPVPPNAPHDTTVNAVIAQWCVVIVIIVALTGTRLALRLCRKDLKWGLDDVAITIASVMGLGYCIWPMVATRIAGIGKHKYDVTYKEYETFFSGLLTTIIFYYCTVTMIKVSICLFNLRLTGVTSRAWRIYHYVILACLAGFALGVILMYTASCNPPMVRFSLSDFGRRDYMTKCNRAITSSEPNTIISVLHVVFDLFLLPVPLIVIWRLQMAISQRIRLVFLFSIGLLSMIGAVMRAANIKADKGDSFYDYAKFQHWTIIDLVFGFAVANLPTLNALLPKKSRKPGSYPSARKISGPTPAQDSTSSTTKIGSEVKAAKIEDEESLRNDSWQMGRISASTPRRSDSEQPEWDNYHPNLKVIGRAT